ncbi:hypothetical protein [Streptomyces sp. SID13031]|uniref:hypothetical protein n=1 Tax=Streptomyces sp. SID13031 TaxID=2706046 RepID=UPI0013C98123|nr:hypothetical protein [Streptomyces sp. SID13031]NEA36862.1 hypothetical protein [Streptomyces sp. SID13031]
MNVRMSQRQPYRLLAFATLLAVIIWGTLWVGVLIHELSHLLVSGLFGAKMIGIKMPAFGDGYGNFSFDDNVGSLPRVFPLVAGPLSQIIFSLVALRQGRRVKWRWLALVLAVYSVANLLFGLQYVASSLYSTYGDAATALILLLPPCSENSLVIVSKILAIATEATILVASYFLARRYLEVQQLWFPKATVAARLRILMVTAAPASAVFMAAYVLTNQGSPNVFFGGDAKWNIPARDLQIQQYAEADRTEPTTAAEVCRRAVNKYANQLIGDRPFAKARAVEQLIACAEVPPPKGQLPLLPFSGALVALGGLAALLRARSADQHHQDAGRGGSHDG